MSHRGVLEMGDDGKRGGGLSGEVSYRMAVAVRLAHERTKVEWSMAEHTGAPDPRALSGWRRGGQPRSSRQMHSVTYIGPPIVCGEHHH